VSEDTSYSIVFNGELADGANSIQVKQKAAQLFKMDEQKVEGLFQRGSVVLKKGLSLSAAQKYQKIIANIGMLVSIQDNQPATNTATTEVSPAPTSSPDHPAVPDWEVKPVGEMLTEYSEESEAAQEFLAPDFSLAPQPCNILEDDEKKSETQSPNLPNLDSITIKTVGESLLDDTEKRSNDKLIEVNNDHLETTEVGIDLLNREEKKTTQSALPDTTSITLQENS